MADTTGREADLWPRAGGQSAGGRVGKENCSGDKMVGLLLPSSTAGALANIGVH